MVTEERLNRRAVLVLLVLAGVLAYTTFQWGGVVRTGRYQCLLVLGLLAMLLSLGRSQDEWSPLPGRALRWTTVLLPAYVLLQVVPLPVAVLRVLSPARAEAMDALGPVGAKVSFASLSVFPAGTFQYFLLVCGYMVIFLLACTLTWRFAGPALAGGLAGYWYCGARSRAGTLAVFWRNRGANPVGHLRQPQSLLRLFGDGAAVCGDVPDGRVAPHTFQVAFARLPPRLRLRACGLWLC